MNDPRVAALAERLRDRQDDEMRALTAILSRPSRGRDSDGDYAAPIREALVVVGHLYNMRRGLKINTHRFPSYSTAALCMDCHTRWPGDDMTYDEILSFIERACPGRPAEDPESRAYGLGSGPIVAMPDGTELVRAEEPRPINTFDMLLALGNNNMISRETLLAAIDAYQPGDPITLSPDEEVIQALRSRPDRDLPDEEEALEALRRSLGYDPYEELQSSAEEDDRE